MWRNYLTGLICVMLTPVMSCTSESSAANAGATAAEAGAGAASGSGALSGAAATNPSGLKAALGDPNVVAKLRDVGLEIASNTGVSSPMKMYVVAAADHQDVETILSGAIINDHAPVYVIVMTGGPFTAPNPPPGVPAPQSSVLTVTVDAATYRVADIGFVNAEPDLSKIALDTVAVI